MPDSSPFVEPTNFLRGFISSAGANLDRLRRNYPAVTASITNAPNPDADAFYAMLNSIDGPCFFPPLLLHSGGIGAASTIDAKLYADIVTAVTVLRTFQSWLTFPGPLRFRGLPTDPGALAARDIAQERLDIYVESLWE